MQWLAKGCKRWRQPRAPKRSESAAVGKVSSDKLSCNRSTVGLRQAPGHPTKHHRINRINRCHYRTPINEFCGFSILQKVSKGTATKCRSRPEATHA